MTEPAEYVETEENDEPIEGVEPPIDADPADYADQLREAGLDDEEGIRG